MTELDPTASAMRRPARPVRVSHAGWLVACSFRTNARARLALDALVVTASAWMLIACEDGQNDSAVSSRKEELTQVELRHPLQNAPRANGLLAFAETMDSPEGRRYAVAEGAYKPEEDAPVVRQSGVIELAHRSLTPEERPAQRRRAPGQKPKISPRLERELAGANDDAVLPIEVRLVRASEPYARALDKGDRLARGRDQG